MSWKAHNFSAVRNPRLDRYWNRAGVVSDGDRQLSTVFVEISSFVTQLSGHLWWKRFGEPYEFIILHERMADGFITDHFLMSDSLDEYLDAWDENTFWDMGEPRDVRWLDDVGSEAVRQELEVEPTYLRQ